MKNSLYVIVVIAADSRGAVQYTFEKRRGMYKQTNLDQIVISPSLKRDLPNATRSFGSKTQVRMFSPDSCYILCMVPIHTKKIKNLATAIRFRR